MKSPRMALDEIVNKIIEEKGLSRRQVCDLIEKKKGLLSHMISEEGAADIVAKELGVNTYRDNEDEELALTIGDLVPGMSNVTITGRANKINPTREFVDKTGREGVLASLAIADKSSEIRVVLWGEAAKLVQDNRIREGNIIRIHDGYVKEDLGGRTELHVGRRGHVEIDPSDAPETEFPRRLSNLRKISELTAETAEVDIHGTVRVVDTMRVVRTKEEREVKLSSLIMEDETGATVRVVLWNDKAPLVVNIKKGDNLEITSGRVRIGKSGETEVHIGSGARVEVSPTGATSTIPEDRVIVGISQLKPGMRDFSLEGCVSEEPRFREFTRADGTTGKILSFILSDDTTRIRVVAWGENAEKLRKTEQGETVRINDPNLKLGIGGEQEVHIKSFETVDFLAGKENASLRGRLEDNPVQMKAKDRSAPRKDLRALTDGESAEIRGMITKVHTKSPFYTACPKCFRKVEWKEGKWLCWKDGDIEKPIVRILYSLTLDDGTGTITCTLSGAMGAELLGIKASEVPSIPNEKKHYDFPDFSNILGMEIVFMGKCILNQNQNRKEFRVSGVIRPDPRAEAKILLEHIRNDFAL